MNKKFYNRVINLIPSQDLKNVVKATNFKFTDGDLLRIIIDYSYDFQEKIELLEIASREMKDKENRDIAKQEINYAKKEYAAFMRDVPNTVYEIEIKVGAEFEYEEGKFETYIVTSFENAILMIKSILKNYNIKAKELTQARYTIRKKTTNLPNKPRDIDRKVGTLGMCILDSKYRILLIEEYSVPYSVVCKDGVICNECSHRCIAHVVTRFPHFLKPYDLVAYYDDVINHPTQLTYGIIDSNMEIDDCYSHVVLIESNEYIKKRNIYVKDEDGYYCVYKEHWHPSFFNIIKPEIKNVPQEILDDYNYAVNKLKEIYAELKSSQAAAAPFYRQDFACR